MSNVDFCIKPNKYTNNKQSCFTRDSLIKIIQAYNKNCETNKESKTCNMKINYKKSDTTEELWKKIYEKLKNLCQQEYCWLSLDFFKTIDDPVINRLTFKPIKPNGKYTWLSTTDLEAVMNQYSYYYPDFRFVGALPIDFASIITELNSINFIDLYNQDVKKIGIIFNMDPSYKDGSHWVSLFINLYKKEINYFDSVGRCPCPPEIEKLVHTIITNFLQKTIKLKYQCNTVQHQTGDSECGVYSLNFLINMIKDVPYKQYINKIQSDKQINKFRNKYFI
jgi:hypothetical protein